MIQPPRCHRSVGAVILSWALATAGCGEALSHGEVGLAPTMLSAGPTALSARGPTADGFALDGTFTLAFAEGDIHGTYTGTAALLSSGVFTGSIVLEAHGGSGRFADVAGTMTGSGEGAGLLGEGPVTWLLSGTLRTAHRPGATPLRVTVSGTTVIGCTPDNRIVLTMDGTGSTRQFGSVDASLTHEVIDSQCSF